ncbi:hypothetical protein ABT340_15680 [Streptosporangium sp. NPDC000239]|uniref:hypothetical protein n=1 Tax=Streptosporangium sp. NPDC000239 TaxID=3154248 RepID=UPI0033260BF4
MGALDLIKDFTINDADYGMELKCVHCKSVVYEIESGDWLECLVVKGYEHKCERASDAV